jgi:hypothetical protein
MSRAVCAARKQKRRGVLIDTSMPSTKRVFSPCSRATARMAVTHEPSSMRTCQ